MPRLKGWTALAAVLPVLGLTAGPTAALAAPGAMRLLGLEGGRLGVSLEEEERGVVVRHVEAGTAAEKAGIKEGDVILRYHGESLWSSSQLARLVRETPAGRSVPVELSRDGANRTVTVTLAKGSPQPLIGDFNFGNFDFDTFVPPEPPEPPEAPEAPEPPEVPMPALPALPPSDREALRDGDWTYFFRSSGPGAHRLGIQTQPISGQLAKYFHVEDGKAVLVASVEEHGAAAQAGLRAGDVLVKFNGEKVTDPSRLRTQVARAEGGQEIPITILRDGKTLELKVKLAAPKTKRREREL